MELNVYLIERMDRSDYDQYSGFVVIHSSEDDALALVDKLYGGDDEWPAASPKEVLNVGKAHKRYHVPRVLLTSYHAG